MTSADHHEQQRDGRERAVEFTLSEDEFVAAGLTPSRLA
jgi:hypothetical protein